jgi:hypothetical protein
MRKSDEVLDAAEATVFRKRQRTGALQDAGAKSEVAESGSSAPYANHVGFLSMA